MASVSTNGGGGGGGAAAESNKAAAAASSLSSKTTSLWIPAVLGPLTAYVTYYLCRAAYRIRMIAIDEYGPVIHEFDPYFHWRATEYLYWNGAARFFTWFDHESWYPLGRPVGTTIYPGLQFTAVWIHQYVLQEHMSLNDVCCYIPAWFGVMASVMTAVMAYECTVPTNCASNLLQFGLDMVHGRKTAPTSGMNGRGSTPSRVLPAVPVALCTLGFMAIVPAHLMRSAGGGYDNECIAMTAMVATFYCWVRSLRGGTSWMWGLVTGLAYFYMVAAWGGYVFVLNMIGVHAALLVLLGRFDTTVYLAYTLFYAVGTALAVQIPVVGWQPLQSLEQLGPAAVFGAYHVLQLCELIKRRRHLTRAQAWKLRLQISTAATVLVCVGIFALTPRGYFGPISARVRGLFVQHTKTGNPLVDSVAEHQPASPRAYFSYLHHLCPLVPVGFVMTLFHLSDASSFLLTWGTATYFFSHKMVRLILLTAPVASILAGIVMGRLLTWCMTQWWDAVMGDDAATSADIGVPSTPANGTKKAKKKTPNPKKASSESSFEEFAQLRASVQSVLSTREGVLAKRATALIVLFLSYLMAGSFVRYCWEMGFQMSNPTIIQKARRRDGQMVLVDDYREAYLWLHDNTPPDSRVMAWWDYGYQIAGIANRTTIADGNTWNHEHIALLGMALTTNLDEGYEIARHWADYVLVWAGGGGDDLAKSPHLARIANSVYREHCPDDPTCRQFGFIDRQGTPSAMMERSFLFQLHSHNVREGVQVPADKFTEVHRSKYGKVRIFKIEGVSEESKAWVADPANRICDAPGSWYCPGQYPPGLSKVLARKKDFQQLGDFNYKGERDEDYTRQYFEDLRDANKARRRALDKETRERQEASAASSKPSTAREDSIKKADDIYNNWQDSEDATLMWQLISSNSVAELEEWLEREPHKAFVRSKDGRGPMWWAFESRNEQITKMLMKAGVPHTDKDADGLTPVDLLEGKQQR